MRRQLVPESSTSNVGTQYKVLWVPNYQLEIAMAVSPKIYPAGNPCQRFAGIAVRKGFITSKQAKIALTEQLEDNLNNKDHRLVGTILLEKGWITVQQIDVILNELFPKAY